MIGTVGVPVVVAAAGTPVQVISFITPVPRGDHVSIHGVMFQVLPSNTGLVYVGRRGMNKATFAQLYAILPIPTDNFLPTFSAALTISPNGLALEEFWVDADVSSDGVIVSFLQT